MCGFFFREVERPAQDTSFEELRPHLLDGRPFVVTDGARGLPMAVSYQRLGCNFWWKCFRSGAILLGLCFGLFCLPCCVLTLFWYHATCVLLRFVFSLFVIPVLLLFTLVTVVLCCEQLEPEHTCFSCSCLWNFHILTYISIRMWPCYLHYVHVMF